MQIILGAAVHLKQVIVDFRAGGVDSLGKSVDIVVVGAGEPDAKLGEAQSAVVASLFRADVAEVGDGEPHLVGSVARAIIGGVVVVVRQVEGGGELVAAVNAHAGRVDVDGGHVATHGT